MLVRCMIRLLALGAIATVLAHVGAVPARASWGGFVPLPNTSLEYDPSCAVENAGVAFCAGVGTDSKFMYSRWNGATWSAWTFLPGVVTSAPSCVSQDAGAVMCAARSGAGEMVVYSDSVDPVSLSRSVTQQTLAVSIASAPSCAFLGLIGTSVQQGSVLCAGRAPNGGLATAYFDGTTLTWTPNGPSGTLAYSPPGCTLGGLTSEGEAVCAFLTTANEVMTQTFDVASGWSHTVNIGGFATHPPVCVNDGFDERLACFATGTDSSLYANIFNGTVVGVGAWSGWHSAGGLVHGYACAPAGLIGQSLGYVCAVTGLINSGFWTNQYTGSNWTGWVQQGTATYVGSPSCFDLMLTPVPPNFVPEVMCVVRQENGIATSITGP